MQVFDPKGPALNQPYLVIEAFHETERHFVFGLAVDSDAIPVTLNHGSKFFKGLQPLPFQLGLPVLEELSAPGRVVVVP